MKKMMLLLQSNKCFQ